MTIDNKGIIKAFGEQFDKQLETNKFLLEKLKQQTEIAASLESRISNLEELKNGI